MPTAYENHLFEPRVQRFDESHKRLERSLSEGFVFEMADAAAVFGNDVAVST